MTTAVEALPFIDGIVYGEGPRWHNGRLWFSDGPAGRVYSAGESGDLRVEAEVPHASGLGWLPDGTLVVSALFEAKIHHVDATWQCVSHLRSRRHRLVHQRPRRLRRRPRLRRSLPDDAPSESAGAIGLVDPGGGSVRIVAKGLALPNGMGFLPDGSTLVVSETKGSRILAFHVEPDGSLGARRTFADLGAKRHPDGLCIDIEGGVWVGCVDTGEFIRVIAGGTVTHRVAIDRGWAIAPALGGADGRTLYMVVDDTTIEGVVNGESTGWIMQARVDVPGAGSP